MITEVLDVSNIVGENWCCIYFIFYNPFKIAYPTSVRELLAPVLDKCAVRFWLSNWLFVWECPSKKPMFYDLNVWILLIPFLSKY